MGILRLSDEYLDYNSKLVTEVGVEEIAEEDRLSNSATYPSLNIISSILDLLSYWSLPSGVRTNASLASNSNGTRSCML